MHKYEDIVKLSQELDGLVMDYYRKPTTEKKQSMEAKRNELIQAIGGGDGAKTNLRLGCMCS